MNRRAVLERRISRLQEDIDEMKQSNDGSIGWLEDIREMIADLWSAQEELDRYHG